jgi:hypothetical protein
MVSYAQAGTSRPGTEPDGSRSDRWPYGQRRAEAPTGGSQSSRCLPAVNERRDSQIDAAASSMASRAGVERVGKYVRSIGTFLARA